jgi:hypothetical protein
VLKSKYSVIYRSTHRALVALAIVLLPQHTVDPADKYIALSPRLTPNISIVTLAVANTTNSAFHIHIFSTAYSFDFAISAKTRIVAIIATPYLEERSAVSAIAFLNN